MPKVPPRSPFRVRLSIAQHAALERIAAEDGESAATLVRRLIDGLIARRPARNPVPTAQKEVGK